MNKLNLFALLAVCVISHPVHEHMHSFFSSMRSRNGSSSIIFSPTLPNCSYEMKVVIHFYNVVTGEVEEDSEYVFSVHGDYFRETDKITVGHGVNECKIIRPDLSNSSCFASGYNARGGNMCFEKCYVTREECVKERSERLEAFIGEFEYDTKEEGEIFGQKCTIYKHTDDNYGTISLVYADSKDYILRFEKNYTEGGKNYSWTQDYTYKNYAPLSSFVITNEFPNTCSSESYTAPTKQECDEPAPEPSSTSGPSSTPGPSGSQTSSSNMVNAAIAMIFASAVIALF